MIFKVTVFAVALPFFGVTVTVTLHDPALRAFTPLPDTLQNLLDALATLIAYFAPAGTFTFASAINVDFDAVFPGATFAETVALLVTGVVVTVVEPVPLDAGTVVAVELPPLDAGTVVAAGAVVATTGSAVATTLVRALGSESQPLPAMTLAVTQ